ncbi:peptidylprolyl isomerase [Campylobacter helveticus]|uniref:SurA N-terminal domain-containing protein n=1 Tax=Campylobacter helveticus TaxID=28898 RepID=A0AAX2UL92_9BACT|nr:peptidyl-prolyl cis-trans isomerase [Campylobacter helveticus]ARE81155.1 hypothetical protein (SurA domain) [Campylobacter helveticus]MCR2055130.1 hypothetical protein [Campylobacter helveticus]MCR2057410.1 hypothetical protein [Campylobacter helveticus]MCR2059525.1 hypothetical protein [Campylobacter helveticus]MCR2062518.1 hypothetical protein [Campylobacter helveticus]
MRKFLMILLFLVGVLNAKVLNSVALIVEKEPITNYDIEQTMKVLKVPREQALAVLINEKMELSQMKQFAIVVNELEVDAAVSKILSQNKMNLEQFKNSLKARGQSYELFRHNLKKDLEKRKLYEKIASMNKTDFSEESAKNFFEENKEKFILYTSIDVKIYRSNQQDILEKMKAEKKVALKGENVNLNVNNADPRLLALLSQLKIGEFSSVLNSRNGFELYEVRAKSGANVPEFEQIKDSVMNVYFNEQRQNYIQDYFDKLRSKLNIEYLKN